MYKEKYSGNKVSDEDGTEKRKRSRNKWKEAETQNNRELQRS